MIRPGWRTDDSFPNKILRMAWRPAHLYGLNTSDQAMMEEMLELLAADSPIRAKTTPTSASTIDGYTAYNDDDCSGQGQSYTSASDNYFKEEDDDSGMQSARSAEEKGDLAGTRFSDVLTLPSRDEEKHMARDGVKRPQGSNGHAHWSSMPTSLMSRAREASTPRMPVQNTFLSSHNPSPWSPHLANAEMDHFFGGDQDLFASAASASAPHLEPAPSDPTAWHPLSPFKKLRASITEATSAFLPTGERVHVMNSAEFDELRRKLRMQTASRRYRKRKKEEARQQRAHILELQVELTRLKEINLQTKQYQRRSIESLEKELKMHEDEVTVHTEKVRDAVKEEREWIDAMSSSLRVHHRPKR